MFCTRCGHPNKDEARFCANCGAPLHEDTTVGIAPVEVEEEAGEDFPFPGDHLDPGQGLLLVKRGQNAGSTFLIDADVTTIGRNPSSDVFLDDVTVSRRHAELRRAAGRFELHDVGSLNGTYVNRERVETVSLRSGDEVQIGKFKLAFFESGE
ncbi:MAG TPA: FHA domain-containing protein [Actinomycetota bacterium]|nr:FHA domain-containing protein [Actinomycetota bacterium]